jgi:hypothetical protein
MSATKPVPRTWHILRKLSVRWSKPKPPRSAVASALLATAMSLCAPLAPGLAEAQDWLAANAAGRSCVLAFSDNTTQAVPCSGTLTLPPCTPTPTRAPVSMLMTDEFGIQHTKSLMRPAGITDQVNQTPGSPGACLPVAPPPPPSGSPCELGVPVAFTASMFSGGPVECSWPAGNYRLANRVASISSGEGGVTTNLQTLSPPAGVFTLYTGDRLVLNGVFRNETYPVGHPTGYSLWRTNQVVPLLFRVGAVNPIEMVAIFQDNETRKYQQYNCDGTGRVCVDTWEKRSQSATISREP